MESGWEPGVKKYFTKILNTVSWCLIWLIACATAGIYYQLGYIKDGIGWPNLAFFGCMLITGIFLFRYLYKNWKNG